MYGFLVFAAEGAADHGSKTAFYVAGLVLTGFALLVGGIGAVRPSFAERQSTGYAILGTGAVLVAATIAAAIATSS